VTTILGLIESYTEQRDIQGLEALLDNELNKPVVALKILRKYIQYQIDSEAQNASEVLYRIARALDSHLEVQISHKCVRCGFEMKGMYWQCPSCHGWGTIHPRDDEKKPNRRQNNFYSI
jgi:lipopolysaccharide biosynthesis regulator YciM